MNIKLLLLTGFALMLTACASTPIELNRETLTQKKINKVVVFEREDQLSYTHSDSSSAAIAAGGLLGAVIGSGIDSGVNKNRQANTNQINLALENYKPYEFLAKAVKNMAVGGVFSESLDVVVASSGIESLEKGVLYLSPNFIASPDLKTLTVISIASLQQTDEGSPYTFTTEGQEFYNPIKTTKEESRDYWVDNPRELAKDMETGAYAVTSNIVNHFNNSGTPAKLDVIHSDYVLGANQANTDSNVKDDSKVEVASIESQKTEIETPIEIETAYPEIVEKIKTGNPASMRNAAKYAGENNLFTDAGIFQAAVFRLEKEVSNPQTEYDKFYTDGLSWCALILGRSKDERARSTLGKVVASKFPKKARSHAIHAIKILDGLVEK